MRKMHQIEKFYGNSSTVNCILSAVGFSKFFRKNVGQAPAEFWFVYR